MTVTLEQVRAVHTVTELVHAIAYLCPDVQDEFEALGLEPRGQGYVAGRAAPMGAVGPELAIATFYNFNPALHRYALPAAWDIASPDEVLAARFRGMQAVYERVEAPTDGLDELTALAQRAADGLELSGRPLAAANAGVALPEQPFARAWQALTVLREFRGDGHIVALAVEGLDGCEALVTHGAAGDVSAEILKATRQRTGDDWLAAEERLRERGWLDSDLAFTDLGRERRDWIEARTDELAAAPYDAIGVDGCARLRELCRPVSQAMMGAFG